VLILLGCLLKYIYPEMAKIKNEYLAQLFMGATDFAFSA
jgi:hypothetical protein